MRFVSIDFLRGIAVSLVLFRHFGIIEVLGRIGWSGVDLFFVLSGFLVSGLLFNEYKKTESINSSRFLIRRGFKIYPAFYAFILFTVGKSVLVILLGIEGNKNFTIERLLAEVFFVQNYFGRLWAHTWSLAVEEHFYLFLIALISFLVFKKQLHSKHLFLSIFLLIGTACLVLRWNNYISVPFTVDTHYYYTHLRLDSLFFGVLLSHYYHFNRVSLEAFVSKNKILILGVGLLCLSCMFLTDLNTLFMNTLGLTFTYLGYGAILLLFLSYENYFQEAINRTSGFLIKLMSFIGFHSYSIYLWHLAVLVYVVEPFFIPLNSQLAFAIYFSGSIAVGVIATKLIENPLLKYRNKKFPILSKHVN
jgi:peptidoglycan/LPS O-acetylase OafA/YrhL